MAAVEDATAHERLRMQEGEIAAESAEERFAEFDVIGGGGDAALAGPGDGVGTGFRGIAPVAETVSGLERLDRVKHGDVGDVPTVLQQIR